MKLGEKPEISKLNNYLHGDEVERTQYMALLHDAFPLMDTEDKEKAYVDTFMRFPETLAYAMLKMSTDKGKIKDSYWDEYKESYRDYLEDIETDLVIAFGDVGVFLTYTKLYILNMGKYTDELAEHIVKVFKDRKFEKEHDEWLHKRIF